MLLGFHSKSVPLYEMKDNKTNGTIQIYHPLAYINHLYAQPVPTGPPSLNLINPYYPVSVNEIKHENSIFEGKYVDDAKGILAKKHADIVNK